MKSPVLAAFLASSLLAPAARAQQGLASISGQGIGDRFGASAIRIPDQNGDGVWDVLVGAPGRNVMYCVSGSSLASGAAPTVIWVKGPPPPGANFATSLALVGDLTGDGIAEFVVSAPLYATGGSQTGAVYLYDGSTATLVSIVSGYPNSSAGRALAAVGDQNGDGLPDLVLTVSPTTSTNLRMAFLSGAHVLQGGSLSVLSPNSLLWGAHQGGENLASGFDHDNDGRFDVAVGAPESNAMRIYRADGSWTFLGSYTSTNTGERACASISANEDYDGDGVVDFLIGAPNTLGIANAQVGRVLVLSGVSILAPSFPPVVLTTLTVAPDYPTGIPARFGTRVLACSDLTGDGVGDILVGSPLYSSLFPVAANRGAVTIHSGATFARLGEYAGVAGDQFGDMLLDGMSDLNSDGFPDFVAAGSLSNNPQSSTGVLRSVSLFPTVPSSYCTAKLNSLGCAPTMQGGGTPSVSSAAAFMIWCTNVLNQKSGLYFYSHHPNDSPFQGGTLCVQSPTRRTPAQNSGGAATGASCTGLYSIDFNARIRSGVDVALVAGAEVFLQTWSRDPASASSTSLSNGLRFLINP